jgi:hypothetical protein
MSQLSLFDSDEAIVESLGANLLAPNVEHLGSDLSQPRIEHLGRGNNGPSIEHLGENKFLPNIKHQPSTARRSLTRIEARHRIEQLDEQFDRRCREEGLCQCRSCHGFAKLTRHLCSECNEVRA